jgi:hypothetical protein
MHPSYFAILDDDGNPQTEVQMAASVSEWLVAKKFWQLFNERFEADFAQFEDSVLPVTKIESLVLELERKIEELKSLGSTPRSFRYGWNAEKVELLCDVEEFTFTQEISALILLLQAAKGQNKEVYCQL